jgi:hypothetical protein
MTSLQTKVGSRARIRDEILFVAKRQKLGLSTELDLLIIPAWLDVFWA